MVIEAYAEENPEAGMSKVEKMNAMHDAGEIRGAGDSPLRTTFAIQPYGTPVDQKKGSFPWKRASKDINEAKRRRRQLDEKRRIEKEAAARRLELKKRKIARQMAIRRVEQDLASNTTGNMILQAGSVGKPKEQLCCFKDWDLPAEQEDYDGVQTVLRTYNRILRVIFTNYSGTGKSVKFKNMTDFDWLAERKRMLVMPEIIRVFLDHKVIPGLIPKEEFVNLLKKFCHRVSHTVENNYLDYPNFVQFFSQVAICGFSGGKASLARYPPCVAVKGLFDHMRRALKAAGKPTDHFENPDKGTGDLDIVRRLNRELA
jgi:hypothetical protein